MPLRDNKHFLCANAWTCERKKHRQRRARKPPPVDKNKPMSGSLCFCVEFGKSMTRINTLSAQINLFAAFVVEHVSEF